MVILSSELNSFERTIVKTMSVEMSTQYTCASLVQKPNIIDSSVLIVGDTRGNLILFDYNKTQEDSIKNPQKPYQIYKVH